jgi:hypothetical protein
MLISKPPAGTDTKSEALSEENAKATPSGPKGDNPATAGPGPTAVRSGTPENAKGEINPSPEDTNVTPKTAPEK